MARSFLNATDQAAAKAARPTVSGPVFADKVAMGMAIGDLYRAGRTREAVAMALVNGPAKLTTAEAEEGIVRWEKNQKLYGKTVTWPVK